MYDKIEFSKDITVLKKQLGVDPKSGFMVLKENGKVIKSAGIDVNSPIGFQQGQKIVREAVDMYVRMYPEKAKEHIQAAHQMRQAALNKYQSNADYSWRLAMFLPLELDLFIKKHIPNYLENKKFRRWMMKNLRGFAVPDSI